MKITIVLAAVLACASAAPNKYIIGGAETTISNFPYLVSVQWGLYNTYYHICGGAILDSKRVITAKHCCKHETGDLFVLANSDSVKVKQEDIKDLDFYSVENIDLVTKNTGGRIPEILDEVDLCILELKTEMNVENIPQLEIAEISNDPNAKLQLAGWGYKEFGISEMSEDVLRQSTNIEIKTREQCLDTLKLLGVEEEYFHEDKFCTMHDVDGESEAQTVCNGDSGGPLVQVLNDNGDTKYNLIGVVSWGIVPCGARGIPSIFTDVFIYKDQIKKDSSTGEELSSY